MKSILFLWDTIPLMLGFRWSAIFCILEALVSLVEQTDQYTRCCVVKSLYERRVCASTTTQHMVRQDEPRHIVLEELIRESLMEINDRLLVNVVYVPVLV